MENNSTVQKIFWLTAGAVSGAILGYMISEVVVDRIVFGPRPVGSKAKEDEPQEIDMEALATDTNHRKHPYNKPSLAELTRELEYTSKEPQRIVTFDSELAEQTETIHYYEKDTTFTFENGDQIDDPNGLFIPNVHLHFGEKSPDKDIVYVRNDDIDMTFEIIRMDKSYAVEILGQEDPDASDEKKVEEKPKRNRRAAKPKPKPEVADLTDEYDETDGK